PGPGRCPGGPAGPGLRDAAGRLRPLCLARPGQAHGRGADGPRRPDGPVRLRHRPPAEERGDPRADRQGPAGQVQARPAHHQHRPRGIVDEEALADAIRSGQVQGAGLDVFAKEPTTESPLFELASVVVAPHLGASTAEAQDKAGVTIAEQVILALDGDFVPFAVNVAATDVSETVRPYMGRAEQLGRILSCLNDGLPDTLEIEYQGGLAGAGTGILTLSVLKGLFAAGSEEPVSYVNAPQLAAERGLEVRETSTVTAHDFVNL